VDKLEISLNKSEYITMTFQFLLIHVEGMDMVEDMTTMVDVEVVEREHEGVVLVKHWIGDGAEMHQRTHQERKFAKSGC
jgi:streptomycin 6-kinase